MWELIERYPVAISTKWGNCCCGETSYAEKKRCPECGFTHKFIDGHDGQYNYCPQCGTQHGDSDVGKTCYKIYVIAERPRFPGTYYNYFCDTTECFNYWKHHILYGGKATLYARERPFTKSDRNKLGRVVFWTKEEAEAAIGIIYQEEDI